MCGKQSSFFYLSFTRVCVTKMSLSHFFTFSLILGCTSLYNDNFDGRMDSDEQKLFQTFLSMFADDGKQNNTPNATDANYDNDYDNNIHALNDINLISWMKDKQMTKWAELLHEMTALGSAYCGQDLYRVAYEGWKGLQEAETSCDFVRRPEDGSLTWVCDSDLVKRKVINSLWALRMFDVWGRPTSGLASQGQLLWLGDYSQCTHLHMPIFDNQTAKYCLAISGSFKLLRDDAKKIEHSKAKPSLLSSLVIKLGLCLPPVCQKRDVVNLMNIFVQTATSALDAESNRKNYSTVMRFDARCTGDVGFEWTQSSIAMLVISCILVCLVLIGTAFDRYEHKKHEEHLKRKKIRHWMETRNTPSLGSSTMSSTHTLALRDCEIETVLSFKSGASLRQNMVKGKWWKKIILGFSLTLNVSWLFNKSKKYSEGSCQRIDCIYGLRVLSMFWIVVCHGYLFSPQVTSNMAEMVYRLKLEPLVQIVHAGTYAVDTFLVLSGLLTSYVFFRTTFKKDGSNLVSPYFWFFFVVHRWLRLVPAYVIVLLFSTSIFPQMLSGPFWSRDSLFGVKCDADDWWKHLLFIYNFFPGECLPWLWYLSVDMQLYLISPLFLITLWTWPGWGVTLCVASTIVSSIVRASLTSNDSLPPNMLFLLSPQIYNNDYAAFFKDIYIKPYTRAGPFIIGILFGWFLVKSSIDNTNNLPKSHRRDSYVWFGAFVVFLWLLFGAFPLFIDVVHDGVYNFFIGGVGRSIWASTIVLIIYLCRKRTSCYISAGLSWTGWRPLARLTYSGFLVHELVIVAYYYSLTRPFIFHGHLQMIGMAMLFTAISLIVSIVINLFVESPPRAVERLLFRRRASKHVKVQDCSKSIPNVQRASMTGAWVLDPQLKFSDIPYSASNLSDSMLVRSNQDISHSDGSDNTSVKLSSSTVSFEEKPRIFEYDPEQDVIEFKQVVNDDEDANSKTDLDTSEHANPRWLQEWALSRGLQMPKINKSQENKTLEGRFKWNSYTIGDESEDYVQHNDEVIYGQPNKYNEQLISMPERVEPQIEVALSASKQKIYRNKKMLNELLICDDKDKDEKGIDNKEIDQEVMSLN